MGNGRKIGDIIKNVLLAIFHGELLLRLHINRYYIHVLCAFVVMASVIWVSLAIDNTLAKVEKTKLELHELQIKHSEKVFDLTDASRRSSVESNLKKLGSKLEPPHQAPTRIKQ